MQEQASVCCAWPGNCGNEFSNTRNKIIVWVITINRAQFSIPKTQSRALKTKIGYRDK